VAQQVDGQALVDRRRLVERDVEHGRGVRRERRREERHAVQVQVAIDCGVSGPPAGSASGCVLTSQA
jgi:hypothetical protein